MSKTWEDALRGLVIVSAAIVDDTTFVFTANWDETYKGPNPPRKYHDRAVFCDLKAGTWGGTQFDRFSFARCAAGPSADKQKQALFADGISQVMSFTFPDGPREAEGFMPIRAAANLFFAGQHFYAYGLGNAFLRRNGPDDWTILSEATGDRATQRKAGNITAGNGYSDNDIYLWNSGPLDADDPMDKIGHLLHWDGQQLSTIPVPPQLSHDVPWSPFRAYDICCAPDGRVFISGWNGELIVGNRQTGFTVLAPQVESCLPGMHMAWFKGKLYGAIDAGLFSFNFEENRWLREPFVGDPNAPVNFPYIDANENVMLLAGGYGAAIYDGERWARIAGDVSALDITRLQLMQQMAGDMVTLRDIMRDLAEGQDR